MKVCCTKCQKESFYNPSTQKIKTVKSTCCGASVVNYEIAVFSFEPARDGRSELRQQFVITPSGDLYLPFLRKDGSKDVLIPKIPNMPNRWRLEDKTIIQKIS